MAHERFYQATDKLMHAFMTGTLKHGDCESCAVGTMVNGVAGWMHITMAPYYSRSYKYAKDLINTTGYLPYDILRIEDLFERVNEPDGDGFLGLCRVFDYLVALEDWTDESKVNLVELCEKAA